MSSEGFNARRPTAVRIAAIATLALLSIAAAADPASAPGPRSGSIAAVDLCQARIEHHPDGALRACQLARELRAGGIAIPPGSNVQFRPNGDVDIAWLGAGGSAYGLALPEGTVLFLTPGGQLRHFWLPRDTMLQGHLVKGQDDGAGARLHPNGSLLAIWLARDEVIDGVPCTSSGNVLRMGLGVISLGTRRMAWFHDSGRLEQAMLSEDITLQGRHYSRGDVVRFDREGRLMPDAKLLYDW